MAVLSALCKRPPAYEDHVRRRTAPVTDTWLLEGVRLITEAPDCRSGETFSFHVGLKVVSSLSSKNKFLISHSSIGNTPAGLGFSKDG